MNKAELDALKATMPWRQERLFGAGGCVIRVIDKNGNEVPITAMVDFVCLVSERFSVETKAQAS